MSVARKLSLIVVMLCVLMAVGSTAVAAESIDEPDNWGGTVIGSELPGPNEADDLKNASINYNETGGFLQFRINFTDDAPANPLSSNITQIYIDAGAGGIDDDTYPGSGTTATFYDNLDTLNADERITVGDGTSVVSPWNEPTSGFDGTKSEKVVVKLKEDYAVVQVAVEDIDNPDDIDYKFVYIDTRNGIENTDDYTWAPDPNNDDDETLRFSLTGTGDTVPVGTINATVNISDTPAAADTDVEFSLNGGTPESKSLNGDNNVSKIFSVDSGEFDGDTDDTITATIDGENYTLDKTKDKIDVSEGSVTNVTFNPYELINVSGEVSDTVGGSGYTIELQDSDGDPVGTAKTGTGSGEYEFVGVSTAKFASGGEVVASLNSEDTVNVIENDSDTNRKFSTSRYHPSDVEVNFTIKGPTQDLSLATNVSSLNEYNKDRFNLTVDASVDADGDRIDSFKHVIEYDPAQITVVQHTPLVSSTGNVTDTMTEDGLYETFIYNTNNESGEPVIEEGATDYPVYNITFELTGSVDPPQGDSASSENTVPIDMTTIKNTETEVGKTEMVNSTAENDEPVKRLEFATDAPGTVDVFDTETVIEPFALSVEHLTDGGDMVGAPVKFNIPAGAVTSNNGKIDRIVLRNNDTNTVVDKIDCKDDASCGGSLKHSSPSNSTYNGSGYITRNRYNITAVPVDPGSNVTAEIPRGMGGQKIFKRADVTVADVSGDSGNVTLGGDVLSVLELRGSEVTGELPWTSNDKAKHDVNNDGVIDIVDVTIVANEYEP